MKTLPLPAERLRAMYAGGQANAAARRFARLWARVFGLGMAPKRWVTLEVTGRRSGRTVRFPLGMADWQGHWYLVPMLGGQCNWSGTCGPPAARLSCGAAAPSPVGSSNCRRTNDPRSCGATCIRCRERARICRPARTRR